MHAPESAAKPQRFTPAAQPDWSSSGSEAAPGRKRIEAVLRAVLRAGAWELEGKRDVPARVVVSEYVDVANAFLDGEETGMVNAVLDGLARALRSAEFDRAGSQS